MVLDRNLGRKEQKKIIWGRMTFGGRARNWGARELFGVREKISLTYGWCIQ
jgi:hypothetical protein